MSSITECVHLGPCNRRLTKSKSERDLRSGPLERQGVPARARRSVFPSLLVTSTKGRWLSADSGGSPGWAKRKEERREVQAGRDERLSTKRVWRVPQVAVTGCRHRILVAKKWVRLVRRADLGVGPRRLQSRDTCPKHRGTRVTNWGIRSRVGTGGGGQNKQGRGQGDTSSQASLGKPGGARRRTAWILLRPYLEKQARQGTRTRVRSETLSTTVTNTTHSTTMFRASFHPPTQRTGATHVKRSVFMHTHAQWFLKRKLAASPGTKEFPCPSFVRVTTSIPKKLW